jgi:tetratricopeptide (TPR) repeat protein
MDTGVNSLPTRADYNLTDLRNLFNQDVLADANSLIDSWVSQAERAIVRNDRTVLLLLIRMVERANFAIPLYLTAYKDYSQAILLEGENKQQEAEELYRRCLTMLANNEGEQTELLRGLVGVRLGGTLVSRSKIEEAEQMLLGTLEVVRKYQNRQAEALALIFYGMIYNYRGELNKAIEYTLLGRTLAQQVGDRLTESKALERLGIYFSIKNRWRESRQFFEESIAIRTGLGRSRELGSAYVNLAIVLRYMGLHEQCLDHLQIAMTLYKQLGKGRSAAVVLLNQSITHRYMKQPVACLRLALQAAEVFRDFKETFFLAASLCEASWSELALDKLPQAEQYFAQANDLIKSKKDSATASYLAILFANMSKTALRLAVRTGRPDYEENCLNYERLAINLFMRVEDYQEWHELLMTNARIILENPSTNQNLTPTTLEHVLKSWGAALKNQSNEAIARQIDLILSYGQWLAEASRKEAALEIYRLAFSRRLEASTPQAKCDLAEHYIKAAALTQSVEAIRFLEEAQKLLREGRGSFARQKEVAGLMKFYRR